MWEVELALATDCQIRRLVSGWIARSSRSEVRDLVRQGLLTAAAQGVGRETSPNIGGTFREVNVPLWGGIMKHENS
jgi:hypothetical protein